MGPHGPALFVHGNPETSAVWGPLLGQLDRDDVVRVLELASATLVHPGAA